MTNKVISFFFIRRRGSRDKFGLVPSEQVPTPSLPTLRVGPLPLTWSRVTTPSKLTLLPLLSVPDSLYPDIMSYGYRCELCIYKSLTSVSEPFKVIVILDLTEHCLGFNQPPASMHQPLFTGQQFPGHSSQ